MTAYCLTKTAQSALFSGKAIAHADRCCRNLQEHTPPLPPPHTHTLEEWDKDELLNGEKDYTAEHDWFRQNHSKPREAIQIALVQRGRMEETGSEMIGVCSWKQWHEKDTITSLLDPAGRSCKHTHWRFIILSM